MSAEEAARTATSISVVVPTLGGPRLQRVLDSLAAQTADAEVVVVDDGSGDDRIAAAARRSDAELLRLERNSGFSKACNQAAAIASGSALVLLNDDCVVDPDFLERIVEPLDPGAGVGMVASVMRDWAEPGLIDSAGMELDRTLLVWDYLNGEPVAALDGGVADPVGPSAAAAAFDREAFRSLGGFDEGLFAYWEDVDLVLRMRGEGLRCRLAAGARGTHEHSASFGSGSARKNYLTGYGRGYVMRKWGVTTPRLVAGALARDAVVCAGQAVIDRNLAGVRGRIDGWRAAPSGQGYPADLDTSTAPSAFGTLRRRLARRGRLRARQPALEAGDGVTRAIAFFHVPGTSGPSRSLERELGRLAEGGGLTVVVPGPGEVAEAFAPVAEVRTAGIEALTLPAGPIAAIASVRDFARQIRELRALIAAHRPQLVVVVTSMIPAALVAAWREGVPALVYCGELYDLGPSRRGLARRLSSFAVARLTGRLAGAIIACSRAVAAQFEHARAPVEVVYPPIGSQVAGGDRELFRRTHDIPADAPLVVSVGYLNEGRAQDVLVRAVAELSKRRPDLHCLIVGEPFDRAADRAYAASVARLVRELGLEGRVVMAGHVGRIADAYAGADVVVNPARINESFGRVAFEAAVAGRPAVVTRVGAVGELLTDGRSALFVERDDPAGIASAVDRLLRDPDLSRRLADEAAAVAARELAPERSLAGFARAVAAATQR